MKIFDSHSEVGLSTCRKNLFAVLSLGIIILLVYSNTFDASWHFDDEYNILKNNALHLKEFNWQNIKNTFYANWDGRGSLYRPAACFSLALNYYISGTDVLSYHIINLLIHSLSSIFLYLFIYHTLNLPILREKYGPNAYFIALLSTVLWAINPVQTQAVTYIVQRMASMAGMFYIMSMYFYLKGRTSSSTPSRAGHFSICFACGALAIFSKENAAMLPLIIITYDLFLIKGITRKSLKKYLFLLSAAIIIILSLAFVIKGLSIFSINGIISGYETREFSLIERLLTGPRILLFYISLLLYPMPGRICFSHDILISKGLFDPPTTMVSIFAIFFLTILVIWKAKRWPLISFCVLFFFMNHIIESTIFPLELVFEHRNYIPSMLLFLPVSLLILRAIKFCSNRIALQMLIIAFTVFFIVAIGNATYIRNFAWKTQGTMLLDSVEKNPNLSRPRLNLGVFYLKKGLKKAAFDQFKKALELPDGPNRRLHFLAHYNMGLLYRSINQSSLAEKRFLSALQLESRYPPAYTQLGILEMERHNNEKALQYFRKALAHEVNSKQERNYAGLVLLKQKRLDEAIVLFRNSLKANPGDSEYILTHLGVAYKYKGKRDKAIKYFREVLKINPNHVPAQLHLMESHLLNGETDIADQIANRLIDLFPNEQISLLINKMILQGDILVEPPNLKIVGPALEKALKNRGSYYSGLASKLKNFRKRQYSQ